MNDHEGIQIGHDFDKTVERLNKLRPPFGWAADWLRSVDAALVVRWLDFFDSFPPSARRARFKNESAYLNAVVLRGETPPLSRETPEPCPDCGHDYFDESGCCLVCDGRIKV